MTVVGRALTAAGSGLAVAGAAHAVVNARLLRQPDERPTAVEHLVSVLVPARDEVHRIGALVNMLRAQQAVPQLEVVVLDDCSTDGTGAAARAAAEGDDRVRVLDGSPPPPGWLGKPHACAQLAAAADPSSEVLVFVDADVGLAPRAVAATLDTLHRSGFDFVSPLPRVIAHSAAERLVQPLLPWSVLTTLPLRIAEHSRRPSLAVLAGPLWAVRRRAYDAAGGHAAVRSEVVDDIAFAHALRRAGAVGGVVDGSRIASIRMYDDWTALRDGYTKSAWSAFGSPARAAAVMAALVIAYVVPAAAAARGSKLGAVGYAAGVAGRIVVARRTAGRVSPDLLAHPVSIAVTAYLTARSVRGHRRGTLRWKGRQITDGHRNRPRAGRRPE